MSTPASIVLSDGIGGIRVQYVRTRRILRLTAWSGSGVEVTAVELPLSHLLRELRVEPEDVKAPRRYLLFAGLHAVPTQGADHLVAAYDDEVPARRAFDDLRAARAQGSGWAELTVLDANGRLQRLGWFGKEPAVRPKRLAPSTRDGSNRPARMSRWKRSR